MRSSLSRLLGLFLLATAAARGQNAPASVFDAIGTQVDKVFASAKPALALVRAQQESFRTAGTGFFIDGDGTLLTTASLLRRRRPPFPRTSPPSPSRRAARFSPPRSSASTRAPAWPC